MHASPALSGQQLHVLVFSYVFFSGVVLVAWLLFVGSLVRTLKRVPKAQRITPIWLLWLTALLAISYALSWLLSEQIPVLLCALVGLVFTWIILPFTLPRSLLRVVDRSSKTAQSIRALGHVGLANQIAITLMFALKAFLFFAPTPSADSLMLPVGGVINTVVPTILALVGATAIITWVFYWARAVSLRVELG